ncbi:ABC transporter permease [Saccharopolyspora sp. HNM0983]|uniref:ABC transporter permease n=1 Tax=Saccharopolyspora montiporae TaxID=2781240 RepID=A0A929BAX5_9PSEU|nr:ABC transporter permease [Saccharopolyspora sp. HNM0983]MBE9376544.1 ABC transporter permease [Saccharopolyspora sp. HNM0983]
MTAARATVLRLALTPFVLAGVVLLAVLLPELTGVDAARSVLSGRYADGDADPQVLEALRAQLGMDQPLPQRIADRIGGLLTGDLGASWVSGQDAAAEVLAAAQISLSIVVGSMLLSFALGFGTGLLAARRTGSAADRAVRVLSRFAAALPEFALAPLLVVVFAVGLQLLPSSGWRGPEYAILPLASLVPCLAAPIAVTTREHARSLRERTFAAAAQAKGLGTARIWLLHIGKPALPPALALLTYSAAGAVAGTTAIEVVFDIPGLGSTLVEAVRTQDVPLVQGGLVAAALAALAIGALGDAAALAADPRTRRGAA